MPDTYSDLKKPLIRLNLNNSQTVAQTILRAGIGTKVCPFPGEWSYSDHKVMAILPLNSLAQ